MKIYIAGSLFTEADRNYLEKIEKLIKEFGFGTYLPHRDGGLFVRGISKSKDFFEKDIEAMNKTDIIFAVLNGNDVDSGTAWEIGFAFSKGIPVIGILDDTRKPNIELLNPMIINSVRIVRSLEELKKVLASLAD